MSLNTEYLQNTGLGPEPTVGLTALGGKDVPSSVDKVPPWNRALPLQELPYGTTRYGHIPSGVPGPVEGVKLFNAVHSDNPKGSFTVFPQGAGIEFNLFWCPARDGSDGFVTASRHSSPSFPQQGVLIEWSNRYADLGWPPAARTLGSDDDGAGAHLDNVGAVLPGGQADRRPFICCWGHNTFRESRSRLARYMKASQQVHPSAPRLRHSQEAYRLQVQRFHNKTCYTTGPFTFFASELN